MKNVEEGMGQPPSRLMRGRTPIINLATALETILQDLRYGVRMLRRSGGFTAVAICALALGIGINTATFTAYKSFFKRPLDGRDSGHLANTALMLQSGGLASDFSYPDYEAYRDNLHSFNGLIAWQGVDFLALSGAGDVEKNRANASGTSGGTPGPASGHGQRRGVCEHIPGVGELFPGPGSHHAARSGICAG